MLIDGEAAGRATVLRGDAANLALADASVDLIVTSPPYWALRSYKDGGEHYDGQIGAEPTPGEFIDSLIRCTAEWSRVLKRGGSMWVNLGDKYATRYSSVRGAGRAGLNGDDDGRGRSGQNRTGVPEKSLIGLPWRYAIRCIDDLGLVLRAEVIWSKPNGLPESVTDRVRRSHEQWFHLVKQPRYFTAVDAIRETLTSASPEHDARRRARGDSRMDLAHSDRTSTSNPIGKLPGSVWEIATQPLNVPDHIAHARCCNGSKRPGCEDGLAHHAAFPMAWPRRIIQGWAPTGICLACGEGRRPSVSRPGKTGRDNNPDRATRSSLKGGAAEWADRMRNPDRITGEACACPDASAPTRAAVVLDPFGGTGTTALVAKALGRHGITSDYSADYCRLAKWRTNDPKQLAKAAGGKSPERRARKVAERAVTAALFEHPDLFAA